MLQAELQQLRSQQEAQLAEREAERQRLQALEAQQDGLLKFVQQLGQKQGWEIPAELLAPPPPPPYRRESTPVSMSTDVLLSLLMLSVKPSDGLRAGFVDVSAFVPDLLMCRPSCWKCGCRPSCRRFSCRFLETSPCRGGAAEIFNFSLHSLHFYLVTHVQSPLFFCSINRGRRRTMSEGRRHRKLGRRNPHIRREPLPESVLCRHAFMY